MYIYCHVCVCLIRCHPHINETGWFLGGCLNELPLRVMLYSIFRIHPNKTEILHVCSMNWLCKFHSHQVILHTKALHVDHKFKQIQPLHLPCAAQSPNGAWESLSKTVRRGRIRPGGVGMGAASRCQRKIQTKLQAFVITFIYTEHHIHLKNKIFQYHVLLLVHVSGWFISRCWGRLECRQISIFCKRERMQTAKPGETFAVAMTGLKTQTPATDWDGLVDKMQLIQRDVSLWYSQLGWNMWLVASRCKV